MDLFKVILNFFIDKKYSFTSKFIGVVVVIMTLFIVDNILGFSFYYSRNQKISQLIKIESLKKECFDNKSLLILLNDTEKDILERKNIFESFFELFSKEKFDKEPKQSLIQVDTVYIINYDTLIYGKRQYAWESYNNAPIWGNDKQWIFTSPNSNDSNDFKIEVTDSTNYSSVNNKTTKKETIRKSRSRIWHTLSSSFFLLMIMVMIPFAGFIQKPFNWTILIVLWIITIFIAGLVWFNQYLFGLIPVIFNRPWINYIINFLINILIMIWLSYKSTKKKESNNK